MKVFCGLVIGLVYGVILQAIYGYGSATIIHSLHWFSIVGSGYVQLLQMIIMPLVFISILNAVAKLHYASSLGRISTICLAILLVTTLIAALVGVFVVLLFGLSAYGLTEGSLETARLAVLQNNYLTKIDHLNIPDLLLSFLPQNPFADLAGSRPTSIIGVVIFAALLGTATLHFYRLDPPAGKKILDSIDIIQLWIIHLVRIIMQLTPYGVMALMTILAAGSNIHDILKLGKFLVASYIGIAIMFIVHGIIVMLAGIHPIRFFARAWPVLAFAFTSRSSAASIPLNIEIQESRMGIPNAIASFTASFGSIIGQNGCAGLYPVMLATMVAPTVGIDVSDPIWIATLVGVVTLCSIGVAGVGGGATFAALIVLPTMGLPVTLVALLISIEPLIDTGRTTLNVSGTMVSSMATSQILRQTDRSIFNN